MAQTNRLTPNEFYQKHTTRNTGLVNSNCDFLMENWVQKGFNGSFIEKINQDKINHLTIITKEGNFKINKTKMFMNFEEIIFDNCEWKLNTYVLALLKCEQFGLD